MTRRRSPGGSDAPRRELVGVPLEELARAYFGVPRGALRLNRA
jgi:hypothetical protein